MYPQILSTEGTLQAEFIFGQISEHPSKLIAKMKQYLAFTKIGGYKISRNLCSFPASN